MNKLIQEILTNKAVRKNAALMALIAVVMEAGSPWGSK